MKDTLQLRTQELYEEPPLTTHIKLSPTGIPRTRWGDNVSKDAQEILKIRIWERVARKPGLLEARY